MTTPVGHIYFLSNPALGKNWTDAESQAVAAGGHLVSINDANENQWLVDKFGTEEGFWIGLTDAGSENNFKWVSGEAVTYTNWAPGEPNEFGDEDYGEINPAFSPDGHWNDRNVFPDGPNVGRGIVEVTSTVVGTSGNDIIVSRGGGVTISGGLGDDLIYGDTGNDSLDGGAGNDTLLGGDGNDQLRGAGGNDTLDGGAGVDTVTYSGETRTVPGATFLGFDINLLAGKTSLASSAGLTSEDTLKNIENVVGSSQTDTIIGNNENNQLFGGDGNDQLRGAGGNDTLDGGAGVDTVTYSGETRTVPGATFLGFDINLLTGKTSDVVSRPSGGFILEDTLKNIENVIGSSQTDTIVGNNDNNQLFGGDGNDQLKGAGGNDTLNGGVGNDVLSGGKGQDRFIIRQGDGIDTITDFSGIGRGTTPTQDTIAQAGTIQFLGAGLTAENMLLTQSGSNLEITFEGISDTKVVLQNFQLENLDNLRTETGATVDLANILFDGQTSPQDSFDVFNGQGGSDTLIGLSGNDTLRGGNGADVLVGNAGDDTLYLGVNDGQSDTVVYFRGGGVDLVNDFVRDGGDRDVFRFGGIPAIDVVEQNGSTWFRVSDGNEGNTGFGSGDLLMKLNGTVGFTADNISLNIAAGNQARFLFG